MNCWKQPLNTCERSVVKISEILYPFQLAQNGGIATTGDSPNLEAQQHVDSLVSTSQGERVMLPTYGVDVASNLFSNSASAVAAGLTTDVQAAMAQWEPAIQVLNVTPMYSDVQEGIVDIEVDYSVGLAQVNANNVNIASVMVGGQVIQLIRSQAV